MSKIKRSSHLCDCGCGRYTNIKNGKPCRFMHNHFWIWKHQTDPSFGIGTENVKTYSSWRNAIQRCEDTSGRFYPNYGGRGIKMCERWRNSFQNFLADMGTRPPKMSIDRIDNDGDYEPSNCRWADHRTQIYNSSLVRLITHKGLTLCKADWVRKLGTNTSALNRFLKSGGSFAEFFKKHYDEREQAAAEFEKLVGRRPML